jgi:hypothetical protein
MSNAACAVSDFALYTSGSVDRPFASCASAASCVVCAVFSVSRVASSRYCAVSS